MGYALAHGARDHNKTRYRRSTQGDTSTFRSFLVDVFVQYAFWLPGCLLPGIVAGYIRRPLGFPFYPLKSFGFVSQDSLIHCITLVKTNHTDALRGG